MNWSIELILQTSIRTELGNDGRARTNNKGRSCGGGWLAGMVFAHGLINKRLNCKLR